VDRATTPKQDAPSRRRPRRAGKLIGAAVVVVLAAAGFALWDVVLRDRSIEADIAATTVDVRSAGLFREPAPVARTTDAYTGYGAWVDAFDYSPNYTKPEPPHLTPSVVDDMAEQGVRTVYLQATRLDERTPGVLEDRWLLAEFLLRSHQRGLRVVGWYLPEWGDDGSDLQRLEAISSFSVLGHRFDGVGVDIEYTADELEPEERSRRLVALSQAFDASSGDDAIGAIVLPPVQIEVINDQYWPDFPWAEIAPHYDVWMPMSYWSFRREDSGYKNGYTYSEESIRRLRNNLGDQQALVHGVGGIGAVDGVDDDATPEEPMASINDLEPFSRSLRDTRAIGGSIYDWRTLEPAARQRLSEVMAPLFP
jgi:hypothetical protein